MRITTMLFLLVCLTGCGRGGESLNILMDDAKQDFAPDKRVALFDIRGIKKGGKYLLEGTSNLPDAVAALMEKCEDAGLNVENRIHLYPDTTLEGSLFGVVNLSACNIRSHPAHSSELATQATLGTPLKLLTRQNDWYLVQTPDGYLGWLDEGGFTPMNEAEMKAWKNARKVVYLPQFGFAYALPDMTSQVVSDLLAGNILRYIGETEKNLTELSFPDGRKAFVPAGTTKDYAEWLDSRNPVADNILSTADEFIGRPYLWGGTSGKAMDCSGFTKTVFFLNGIILPRDASQQVHIGTDIAVDTSLEGLLPGDLLFFGKKATADQKEKITHVAIYRGNGKIIHATGRVKMESLRPGDEHFAEDRLNTLVCAKRVLNTPGENGVQWIRQSEAY
ncbi:MAG: C40 family peptidase [Lewinellaceae bacterium]|nr:C40 family peptidase [Lewinellaceae bacterium]